MRHRTFAWLRTPTDGDYRGIRPQMNSTQWLQLLLAVIAEIAAALLVAMEAAISRMSRARAEEFAAEQRRGAASLLAITRDPASHITSLLFVRIALSVLAVVLVADVVDVWIASPGWSVAVATVIMLVANFIILGVAPRTLGQQHFAGLALRSAGFVRALSAIVAPVTKAMILLGNAITPGKGFSSGPFASEAEIRALLDQAGEQAVIDPDEQRMLESVFELGDTLCRELMVPRTEMVYIERHKRLGQALSLALRAGFTRIPVIGENLDDVVGVVHIKDIVRRLHDQPKASSDKVSTLMRQPMLVPDTKRAADMLREFQATRTHLAVLVDEYGGTAGLLTVEDIVEEIVGEISDEYDADEIAEISRLGVDDFRVSARLALDDLAELTGLDLRDDIDSVDTVAGLLARRLGVVPIPGSSIDIDDFTLTAETAEGRRNRIATVRVRRRGDDIDRSPGADASPARV